MRRSIFLVIPVYNESEVLADTICSVLGRDYSIVVVDDGSSDNSFQIACSFPVYALRHIVNLGQGAALSTGIRYALKKGADVIVTFDADGQHNPDCIDEIVKPVLDGKADVALGSRFLATKSNISSSRKNLLKLAIFYSGITTGLWLSDTHNGFRALSAAAAQQIRITQPRMAHASEIISEIARLHLSYTEIPVEIRYTPYSIKKGQKTLDAFNILIDLFEGRLR